MPLDGGSAHPIVISEEDDVDVQELSVIERYLRRLRSRRSSDHQSFVTGNLTQGDDAQRDPGSLVEVPPRLQDEYRWQFLRVVTIYRHSQWSGVFLRGLRLTRQRNLRGLLPRLRNEICELYDIDEEDERPHDVQATVEIAVTEVIGTRAFSRTNTTFPCRRFNPHQWDTMETYENRGGLIQRWKFTRYWPTSWAMTRKKCCHFDLSRLRSDDVEDEYLRVSDEELRSEFRGGIVRGGSYREGQICLPAIDVDSIRSERYVLMTLKRDQKYTADDYFCGAGGASCGIQQAGLRLAVACDSDGAACASYRANFPYATLKHMNIFRLIEEMKTLKDHSDLLHISPPCQVWSPAHTHPGKNDEANAAALLACGQVLERRRPRISTGEQTFGLLFDRNEQAFNALVGQYTALGYSFSCNILLFHEYGVAAKRRRLIWIASCPREALPPFPSPTHAAHADSRDLPPAVTLREKLKAVQRGCGNGGRLHNPEHMLIKARNSEKFPKPPYDDSIQVGTITTAGAELAHPTGRRNFTLRELAVIQGFPLRYKFRGTTTGIRRQIGNAFPPVVVEILYRHLKEWLWKQDGVKPTVTASHMTSARAIEHSHRRHVEDLIIIDDTSDVRMTGPTDLADNRDDSSNDPIVISGSDDDEMLDVPESDDRPNFSRESSRTLSAESLPSLMEVDMNGEHNTGTRGRVGRDDSSHRDFWIRRFLQ
ncbi:S-adenosyl-L-methionine-dependent methyltransferase [Nemania sp. FL0916]|nr:S-adenosyl-L-methionine-dependent methyltransferase [Nemania sp. FL0916]